MTGHEQALVFFSRYAPKQPSGVRTALDRAGLIHPVVPGRFEFTGP
jgi:hypothetical protein